MFFFKQVLGVQFDAHVSRRWFLASLLSIGIDALVTGPAFNIAAMLVGLFYGHVFEEPPHESDRTPFAGARSKVVPFPDMDAAAHRHQIGHHLMIRVASAQSPTSSSSLSPSVSASQQQKRLDAGLLAPRQAFSVTPR